VLYRRNRLVEAWLDWRKLALVRGLAVQVALKRLGWRRRRWKLLGNRAIGLGSRSLVLVISPGQRMTHIQIRRLIRLG
jgi:hypothetical protein